jgi:hypothetical protein
MAQNSKPCIVACSVLKEEIQKLIKQRDLDVDLVFVSKYFHVDYSQIEKNLRPAIERALQQHPKRVILVYGDLCLGMDNEMKKLAEEYGIVKIDALNCVDCQLGGKGKFADADPNHDLLFLGPGMIEFFNHLKETMQRENIDEDTIKNLFSGLRGIVLLDTLGDSNRLKREIKKLDTGLTILETRPIGLENVKKVILEAIEKNSQKPNRNKR